MLFNHLILFSIGYRWITKFFALTLYALLLMPGFLQGKITLTPPCAHTLVLVPLHMVLRPFIKIKAHYKHESLYSLKSSLL